MFHRIVPGLLVPAFLVHFTLTSLAQSTPAGFEASVATLPVSGFLGGLDALPGGELAVFDGVSVVAIDPDTLATTTIFTPPTGASFGAFVRTAPDGSALYFGESRFGDVWEIPLGPGTPRVVVNAVLPYDLAFAPDGSAWLSWSPGFGQGNVVSSLDLATGALDDAVVSTEVSGPLAFDGPDLLYVRPDSSSFPPPANGARLVRFTAAQLASTSGPATLDDLADGALVAQLDGGFGLAVDLEGNAYVSDSVNDRAVRVDLASGAESVFVDGGAPFNGVTFLAFLPGHGPQRYLPWQPAGGGTLVALRTDFFSFDDAVFVEPARAVLGTSVPSPIPFGPYQLSLTGAQPGGKAIVVLGLGGVAPAEIRFDAPQTGIPMFFGVIGPWLPIPVPLDAAGGFALPAFSLAIPGFTLGVQAFFGDSFAGPFRGTSNPLAIF